MVQTVCAYKDTSFSASLIIQATWFCSYVAILDLHQENLIAHMSRTCSSCQESEYELHVTMSIKTLYHHLTTICLLLKNNRKMQEYCPQTGSWRGNYGGRKSGLKHLLLLCNISFHLSCTAHKLVLSHQLLTVVLARTVMVGSSVKMPHHLSLCEQ
jgi:hypothetical protein